MISLFADKDDTICGFSCRIFCQYKKTDCFLVSKQDTTDQSKLALPSLLFVFSLQSGKSVCL